VMRVESVSDVSRNIHRVVEGALFAFSAFEQALHKASGPVGAGVPHG
jgi:hypothetical protein